MKDREGILSIYGLNGPVKQDPLRKAIGEAIMGKQQAIPMEGGWFKIQYKRRQTKKQLWRAGQSRRRSHHRPSQYQKPNSTRQLHTGKIQSCNETGGQIFLLGSLINKASQELHHQNHYNRTHRRSNALNGDGRAIKGARGEFSNYWQVIHQSNQIAGINGKPVSIYTTKTQQLQRHLLHPNSAINSSGQTSFTAMSNKRPPTTPQPPKLMANTPSPQSIPYPTKQKPTYAKIHRTPPPQNQQLPTQTPNLHTQHPYPQPPQRYQAPPWKHFMDHNPWQFTQFQNPPAESDDEHTPLPLPPNPADPKWRHRCYNCLKRGHEQNECKAPERVCAKCWESGHEAKTCSQPPQQQKKARFDPLQPRGNMGEAALPPNRPQVANVFIPETTQMLVDAQHLNRAIVIDARLKTNHTTEIVQAVLMVVCKSDFPFPLTHMSGTQYMLLLPPGSDRHRFLLSYDKPLQDLGYVSYPWSPAIN